MPGTRRGPRQPEQPGPKWPRSASSASAPATQRNAPPSTIKYREAASRCGLTSRAGWRNQHSGSSQDSDPCSVLPAYRRTPGTRRSHRYSGVVGCAGSSDNEHLETDSDRCGSESCFLRQERRPCSRPTALRRGVIHESGLLVVSVGQTPT